MLSLQTPCWTRSVRQRRWCQSKVKPSGEGVLWRREASLCVRLSTVTATAKTDFDLILFVIITNEVGLGFGERGERGPIFTGFPVELSTDSAEWTNPA